MSYDFTAIEKKWQEYWRQHRSFAALDPQEAGEQPKKYVLDMFPYPSGAGLHVGHVENYTATDIISRFCRMRGFNVLHPTGWDAFGLPAEQYAIKNNRHPREFTATNISNFRRQIQMLGLSYDWDREINTTDPEYYRWTQWIFLKLFNSYFDPVDQKAKPIAHLIHELEQDNFVVAPDGSVKRNPTLDGMQAISGETRIERLWREFSPEEQRDIIDGLRLAYADDAPVNWCPALGTVLANEEVIDGKSEVGGFPVERQPMRQWMLRITAYADRLLNDLDSLDWPESLKQMQRNWIGRSVGAEVDFELKLAAEAASPQEESELITVFTTRPDTLYGATYMVLAPEHPLVKSITTPEQKSAVDAYRAQCASRSERDRMADTKDKSGVFTGAYAINPINEAKIPIYIADYVLMGYGTGAIMAVPAHDERDYEFAKKFNLPIKPVVRPVRGEAPKDRAFEDDGIAINSPIIDGQPTAQAKQTIIAALERDETGHGSVKYKLRDWLFSRQRYWGEPFPIVLDDLDRAYGVDESELPVKLPDMQDFKPTGTPEPPLSKARDWVKYANPQMAAAGLHRETNTMPQWAGSCWYYLRFLDPHNTQAPVDPKKEKYWMPVDLYVGGVEHAVLHLLYARFWHKVLFDLGVVSSREPFARLVNQGLILGETEYHAFYTAAGQVVTASEAKDIGEEASDTGVRLIATHSKTGEKLIGRRVGEDDVEKTANGFRLKSNPNIRVDARAFKMSKSRGNVANPDDLVRDYGADALRLYVMYMGPLEMQKPWNTRDIVGMSRFLSSAWRNLVETKIESNQKLDDAIDHQMHRTIKKVAEDIEGLRFNTAIAELIKLNNEISRMEVVPKYLAENLALMLAPFAPHMAEEIWQRLGHEDSLAKHPWPTFDPEKLVESTMELPVQINGKLRGKIVVAVDTGEAEILDAAAANNDVKSWLEGKNVRKRIYVPGKLVSFVVG
ncbi:MAG TPA: leucine--tRNA ligase [Tepidisphaeraceae bacterium]|nr:leucine--tRNA ligase [Tepidisphaeraceae bacterium]